MTFADLSYTRPDTKALLLKLDELIASLENAKSAKEAEDVILGFDSAVGEVYNNMSIAHIRFTQNTKDEFYAGEMAFMAEAGPAMEEKVAKFLTAMINSPFRKELEERFPKVAFVNAEIKAKTISPAILDLLEKEEKLSIEYNNLLGSIMVEYEGQKLPVPKMALYSQSGDRSVRKAATTATGKAFEEKKAEFDTIFDSLVKVRNEIAQKLGFDNFIQLGYLRMTRNSYGPEEVEVFRHQVKKDLVPLMTRLGKKQAERLELDHLCFYDESILRKGGNPKPVETDEKLYDIGIDVYRNMTPETAEMINKMDSMKTFDLFSREGKMAGGYCSYLPVQKIPFIFANFSGTKGDVEVFTHEGGHAFNAYVCRNDEVQSLVNPTYETCEVHSMSMEFLCWPYLNRFYGDDAEVAKLIHIIDALSFIPYGCLVDEFQHHIYANPNMTPAERNQKWEQLEREYFPDKDYDNLPFYSEGRRWQRQLHIYTSPFYYIDYCLAQTVALEFSAIMRNEGWDKAWERYFSFVKLGGNFTFTQLLEKSGLKSPFVEGSLSKTIASVTEYIDENIHKL